MNFKYIIRKITFVFANIFLDRDHILWQKSLLENERFKKRISAQLKDTSGAKSKGTNGKRVICIYDDNIKNGGLADRFKGIMSMYEICKEKGIEFKLLYTHPFNLNEFLIPNKINWSINSDELSYDLKTTDICHISSIAGTSQEATKQKKWFSKFFENNKSEYHVRTNARIFDNKHFSENFNELFTFAPRLQSSIDKVKKELGSNYISTSFRFLNLLGDFNETFMKETLSPEDKIELIERNLLQLEELHKRYPDKKILVNSDSSTFLHEATKFYFVYTIPGNITHIDNNGINEYATYEKTFLDFFMIADAEKIFLFKTGKMYRSGYPIIASLINNRPFELVTF